MTWSDGDQNPGLQNGSKLRISPSGFIPAPHLMPVIISKSKHRHKKNSTIRLKNKHQPKRTSPLLPAAGRQVCYFFICHLLFLALCPFTIHHSPFTIHHSRVLIHFPPHIISKCLIKHRCGFRCIHHHMVFKPCFTYILHQALQV